MNIKERIRLSRIITDMNDNKEYAERLGLKDISEVKIEKVNMKGKKNESLNRLSYEKRYSINNKRR